MQYLGSDIGIMFWPKIKQKVNANTYTSAHFH